MVLFVYPDKKEAMGVVDPGGGELVFPIILIISACLKSLNCSVVRVIEFWSFIPLFLFFNRSIGGFQDASSWVTEGLVLRI